MKIILPHNTLITVADSFLKKQKHLTGNCEMRIYRVREHRILREKTKIFISF